MNSDGGNQQKAGAGTLGGCIKTVPANFTVGEVGFGPSWEDDDSVQLTHSGWKTVTDKMAESIVRLLARLTEVEAERDFYKAAASKLMHNGRRKN